MDASLVFSGSGHVPLEEWECTEGQLFHSCEFIFMATFSLEQVTLKIKVSF